MQISHSSFRLVLVAGLGVGSVTGSTALAETNFLGIEKAAYDSTVPADRPGFFDNVNLVPKGYFVAEGGVRFDERRRALHAFHRSQQLAVD